MPQDKRKSKSLVRPFADIGFGFLFGGVLRVIFNTDSRVWSGDHQKA